jgi:hypothetical protein
MAHCSSIADRVFRRTVWLLVQAILLLLLWGLSWGLFDLLVIYFFMYLLKKAVERVKLCLDRKRCRRRGRLCGPRTEVDERHENSGGDGKRNVRAADSATNALQGLLAASSALLRRWKTFQPVSKAHQRALRLRRHHQSNPRNSRASSILSMSKLLCTPSCRSLWTGLQMTSHDEVRMPAILRRCNAFRPLSSLP